MGLTGLKFTCGRAVCLSGGCRGEPCFGKLHGVTATCPIYLLSTTGSDFKDYTFTGAQNRLPPRPGCTLLTCGN